MTRRVGLTKRSAREQLQRPAEKVGIQPLPEPYAPAAVAPTAVGIEDPGGSLSFFVLGDVGGVKTPGPQNAVSVAMEQIQDQAAFVLILGDVVYFNGQEAGVVEGRQTGYGDQFYEPYAKLAKPIIAFPGNHDGEPETEGEPQKPVESSLAGFMANFCAGSPGTPIDDPQLEYGRHTQTLPYCEWTLELDAVTIVSVYTNVPSGGHLEPAQIERLAGELGRADKDKPLILGLHHPPYSADSHHGGSEHMGTILDEAFAKSGRTPNLVLSGHVHDYQRFSRTYDGTTIPYVVSGNGGYHNLHQLAKGAEPGEELAEGVVFEAGDAKHYGFLKLRIESGAGSGEYVAVSPGVMPDGSEATSAPAADTFTF
jgi:acid phosphatase type 7